MEKIPKKCTYKTIKKVINKTTKVINEDDLEKKQRYYKRRVDYAIARGKVYRVIGSVGMGKIRIELHRRGFIETVSNNWENELHKLTEAELLEKAEPNNNYESALLTKMLGEHEPDLVWINRTCAFYVYSYVAIMNKVNMWKGNFVTKDGLCECINMWKESSLSKLAEINHPRSYMVSSENCYENFLNDYKLTTAISIILFLNTRKQIRDHFDKDGTIPIEILDCVFQIINSQLKYKEDDCVPLPQNTANNNRWDKLIDALRKLVNENEKFKLSIDIESKCQDKEIRPALKEIQNLPAVQHNDQEKCFENISHNENDDEKLLKIKLDKHIESIELHAKEILKKWPWRKHDGFRNIWLVKPARTGEGAGIKLTSDPNEIKEFITKYRYKPFVIQKYIERPLLVYNTKHDIRQYFLITIDSNYLRAWSHSTACTIKFASEEFNLNDLTEKRHITNTAVQMKYSKVSHPNLPQHHMYTLGAYILYLNTMDKGYLWFDYVYPKIKKTLQAVTMASLENIELRPGRFELFGCDW